MNPIPIALLLLIIPIASASTSFDVAAIRIDSRGNIIFEEDEEPPPEPEVISEPEAGTGSTFNQEEHDERILRIAGWKSLLAKERNKEAEYKEHRAAYAEEERVHRIQCRKDFRSANRDQKFPTIKRCFRGQMTLKLEALRKEQARIIDTAAGDDAKANVTDSIAKLIDAISALIQGIDTNVFISEASMREVKKNLRDQYEKPYWTSLLQLRTDRLSRSTSLTIVNVRSLRDEAPEPLQEDFDQVHACLEGAEESLLEAINLDSYQDLITLLRQEQLGLKDCTSQAKVALKKLRIEQERKEEEE